MRLQSTLRLILAVTLVGVAAPKPEIYRNEEFGIEFPVPNGAHLIPCPDDVHDHGPVFTLGSTQAPVVLDLEQIRAISIFACFNCCDETRKLHDLMVCDVSVFGKKATRSIPLGLTITSLPCEAARIDHADGWIDVIVDTQAGKLDHLDPEVPSINYTLRLHTTAANLAGDLRPFRAILENIHLPPVK